MQNSEKNIVETWAKNEPLQDVENNIGTKQSS